MSNVNYMALQGVLGEVLQQATRVSLALDPVKAGRGERTAALSNLIISVVVGGSMLFGGHFGLQGCEMGSRFLLQPPCQCPVYIGPR